jgi:hypothetical protein
VLVAFSEGEGLPAVPGCEGSLVVFEGEGLLAIFEDGESLIACDGAGAGAGSGLVVDSGVEGLLVAGAGAGLFTTLLGQH